MPHADDSYTGWAVVLLELGKDWMFVAARLSPEVFPSLRKGRSSSGSLSLNPHSQPLFPDRNGASEKLNSLLITGTAGYNSGLYGANSLWQSQFRGHAARPKGTA